MPDAPCTLPAPSRVAHPHLGAHLAPASPLVLRVLDSRPVLDSEHAPEELQAHRAQHRARVRLQAECGLRALVSVAADNAMKR